MISDLIIATSNRNQLRRTFHLLESHTWIRYSFHELETELATILEGGRELGAIGLRPHTTVLIAPTVARRSPLRRTSLGEDSNTTSRDGDIELVGTQITTSVGYLYDHLEYRNWFRDI